MLSLPLLQMKFYHTYLKIVVYKNKNTLARIDCDDQAARVFWGGCQDIQTLFATITSGHCIKSLESMS